MKTEDKLRDEFPNKDYNDKLKKQFTYYDMMQFCLSIQLELIK